MSKKVVTKEFCDERTRRIEQKIDSQKTEIISGIKTEVLPEVQKSMRKEVEILINEIKKNNNGASKGLSVKGWALVLGSLITAISSIAIAVIQSL